MIPSRQNADRFRRLTTTNALNNPEGGSGGDDKAIPTLFETMNVERDGTTNNDEINNNNKVDSSSSSPAKPTSSKKADDGSLKKVAATIVGPAKEMKQLPVNFEPGKFDVIIGRGKVCYAHR